MSNGHPAFNLDTYKEMLRAALAAGYIFEPFEVVSGQSKETSCLLRHDIDVDLGAALRMAQIEHELGIKSTYFLMTRSPVYNLMSRSGNSFAREIIKLGHHIGLHYDQGYYPGEHMPEASWITWESELLERLLNVEVKVVSFHQPSPTVLEGKVDTGSRLNTYTHPRKSGFHYISDSNRVWAKEHPTTVFEQKLYPKLQLLIHPMWWVYGQYDTTEGVWDHAILQNISYMQDQVFNTERAYGPLRVFSSKIKDQS